MDTNVVNIKGFDKDERQDLLDGEMDGFVYIGRGSKWGNPFVIGRDGNREEVIEKYRAYMTDQSPILFGDLAELVGKQLVCYCKPLACHGDVLVEWAEAYETFAEHMDETAARIRAR